MKNNIDYYQHFCNADQHPKFKMLRVKYGWEGEGRFWALNNRIGLSDNCRIDLNKKYNQASLADDLGLNLDQLNEFIDYLHDECNLIIKENGFVTTEIVNQNLEKVMNKRKRNQTDYEKKIKEDLRNIKNTETKIQTSEKTQSKVKESKLKEFPQQVKRLVDIYFGYLDDEQKKRFEKYRDKYHNTCDKLIRLDGYTEEEIEKAIRRGKNSEFWDNNFLSFDKLRKINEKQGVKHIEIFLVLKNGDSKREDIYKKSGVSHE
jgi:polyhydroxyalkanoate synthesis regulator phasin